MKILFIIVGLISVCSGYRILGIYGFPARSHFLMIDQLFKGLARKGHQVDLISPFKQKEIYPNYTQIIKFPEQSEIISSISFEVFRELKRNRNFSLINAFGYTICKNMGLPEFLNLARSPPKDPPYDVIITHMFSYHCFMVLGHFWNIPVVLVSTTALYPWMYDMIGNPENTAFVSNNLKTVPEGYSFWSRLYNTCIFYYIKFNYFYHRTNQNELLRMYFGPNVPSIEELERSASLVLVNTYFPINGIQPMTTGIVEVGGLHIQNREPELTTNLQKWLDESKSGVVYFNLGSILRIEIFPEKTVNIIFESLKKLAPIRILMRVVSPDKLTVKMPENIYALAWIPQEKVLQHPNVKIFITHGGLLGTQESIFYGVPMLCLPLFADQFTNAQTYVEKKIAKVADILSLNQEDFENDLNELLKNPIYSENVKRLSKLFRDRPQSAMDTAIFWIEFVMRNGKDSLRSPAMNLTWWQIALLDVYAVIIMVVLLSILISAFIIKIIFSYILGKNIKSILEKKKHD